jgi:hypothetical protein
MATTEDALEATQEDVAGAPDLVAPAEDWEHIELYRDVYKALYALPGMFSSTLNIDGILATDLFALSSSLGATLEVQVVESLNRNRHLWDEDDKYGLYRFVRQSQTFPDVVLEASAPGVEPRVIMGIELKGWYVLATEGEPTFRFRATPAVSQAQDLLVVFPWALRNVISGEPTIFRPWVTSAGYAAAHRNWHWEHVMDHKGADSSITLSTVTTPYPVKSDEIADRPAHDVSNFGRIARYGLMDEYMAAVKLELLAGVPVVAWQKFLSMFGEKTTIDKVIASLDRTAKSAEKKSKLSKEQLEAVAAHLAEIAQIVTPD